MKFSYHISLEEEAFCSSDYLSGVKLEMWQSSCFVFSLLLVLSLFLCNVGKSNQLGVAESG